MKSLVAKRARITRVRGVQHLLAASAAAQAEAQLDTLENNQAKLAMLRDSLSVPAGTTTGAVLQNRGQLAQRLDSARSGLADAIVAAKAQVEAKGVERLEARQRQESAAKLDQRAAQALAEWTEARLSGSFRPRFTRSSEQKDN